ncbi:MAG: hypothetical protein WC728_04120 [Elusimicrobiota bacterium]
MDAPLRISKKDEYVLAVYSGEQTLAELKRLMREVLRACDSQECRRVLVDLSKSVRRLTLSEKFEFGEIVAGQKRLGFKVAYLTSRTKGGDGFFELVARNRGVWIRRFLERKDALAWLKQES